MGAIAPWTPFGNLRKEMDEMFDRFLDPRDWAPALGEWIPKIDVAETGNAVSVKAEIPGMDQKDIQVLLQDDVLTIKGEKKQEKGEKDEKYYRLERSYGTFARALRMPVTVDAGKVTATFKNGLLTVTLPKAPGAKGTTIPVKGE